MATRRRHGGASTAEYMVVTFALVVALFVPWRNDPSVAVQFMQAVRNYHSNASFPLSLP